MNVDGDTNDLASKLPSRWLPVNEWVPRTDLPIEVSTDAWARVLAHDTRGFPLITFEVFWITPGIAHVARVEGWSAADDLGEDEGVDERKVLTNERLSLEAIEEFHVSLGDTMADDYVRFTGGERRQDLPVWLIVSHTGNHPDGYAKKRIAREG